MIHHANGNKETRGSSPADPALQVSEERERERQRWHPRTRLSDACRSREDSRSGDMHSRLHSVSPDDAPMAVLSIWHLIATRIPFSHPHPHYRQEVLPINQVAGEHGISSISRCTATDANSSPIFLHLLLLFFLPFCRRFTQPRVRLI